ncbi:MAG: nucleotidyltransferase domain-containing protein [Opitutales bacterium]|nr:nucleotidyltransferase domain-containing protein [Opitutales bacterium]
MRLSKDEIQTLKKCIVKHAADARVYLFGSRLDDSRAGGDIDLLVLTQYADLKTKLLIRTEFFKQMEDQKIDLILSEDPPQKAFVQHVLGRAVQL